MKNNSNLSLLSVFFFVCILGCQTEEVDFNSMTKIQLRSHCDGYDHCSCGIGALANECSLDFFITPDPCPTGGTWEVTLDGNPVTPTSIIPNGVTVDNSRDGNYCATYRTAECCVTRCIKYRNCVFDPCIECQECTVSLAKTECRITATSSGCSEPIQINFTYNGVPRFSRNGIVNANLDGEYCVEIVDSEGCTAMDCIQVEGCGECDCSVILNETDCELTACPKGRGCQDQMTYTWETPPNSSSSTNTDANLFNCTSNVADVDGQYCVTMIDAQGCVSKECIDIENCEPCKPEYDINDRGVEFNKIECVKSDFGSRFNALKLSTLVSYATITSNRCCKDLNEIEDTHIEYELCTIEFLNGNHFHQNCYTRREDFIRGGGFSAIIWRYCRELKEGDIIRFEWTIKALSYGECTPDPEEISGFVEYTVKLNDLHCCDD